MSTHLEMTAWMLFVDHALPLIVRSAPIPGDQLRGFRRDEGTSD